MTIRGLGIRQDFKQGENFCMTLYKTLEKTDNQVLYKTFIWAFSDYQIEMNLPFLTFQQMLQRRGYHPEISIGAFKDEILVGFALNGLRKWNGKETAYDIATGVVPEYRREGITSSIFLHLKELLKEKQAEQYLLEVIKSNQPAVQLYQKCGFEIQREFSCFQLNRDQFVVREVHKVEKANGIDFKKAKAFWDDIPSWQNSIASIEAIAKSLTYFVVRFNHAIVGYGIVDKMTGDIPQIAVDREYRRHGIASSILSEIVKIAESEKVRVLNVEINSKLVENFLIQAGFEAYTNQYEMHLKL